MVNIGPPGPLVQSSAVTIRHSICFKLVTDPTYHRAEGRVELATLDQFSQAQVKGALCCSREGGHHLKGVVGDVLVC